MLQLGLVVAPLVSVSMQAQQVKNIVLVHGAWVGGSSWKPVYEKLTADGYQVTIVQEPLTGFADDVQAVNRVLDRQPASCVLFAHS